VEVEMRLREGAWKHAALPQWSFGTERLKAGPPWHRIISLFAMYNYVLNELRQVAKRYNWSGWVVSGAAITSWNNLVNSAMMMPSEDHKLLPSLSWIASSIHVWYSNYTVSSDRSDLRPLAIHGSPRRR